MNNIMKSGTNREQRYYSVMNGSMLATNGSLSMFDTPPAGYTQQATNLPPGGKAPYPLLVKAITFLVIIDAQQIVGGQYPIQQLIAGYKLTVTRDTTDTVFEAPVVEFLHDVPAVASDVFTFNNAMPFIRFLPISINGDLAFNPDNTLTAKITNTGVIASAKSATFVLIMRGLTPLNK